MILIACDKTDADLQNSFILQLNVQGQMLGFANGCDSKNHTLLLQLKAMLLHMPHFVHTLTTPNILHWQKMERQCCPAQTDCTVAYTSTRYDGRWGCFCIKTCNFTS